MSIDGNKVDPKRFNPKGKLPYELRQQDFQIAMQDVYDFVTFHPSATIASGSGGSVPVWT
jgi:hypothetical protein